MIAYGGLTLGYCEENCFNPDERVYFGLAGTALAGGAGMAIAGMVLRHRFKRRRTHSDPARVQLTPSFALAPTGMQLGLAGRF